MIVGKMDDPLLRALLYPSEDSHDKVCMFVADAKSSCWL